MVILYSESAIRSAVMSIRKAPVHRSSFLVEVSVLDRPLLFGKYCLLERISVGGMAEVFRAKPLDAPDPDRYFALKRILPHLAEDLEFIKMFADEARLTVQLRHPNIVHIYELGQFQSSHYIVMEFIAGKDLLAFQKLVRRQQELLDVDMACHIMLEVAKGLDHAHRKSDRDGNPLGIIHRDISPQNVLVSWDGRVRVIDFGIAKAASQSTKTQAGVLKGKFGYLSPEQVRAKPIDRRSDIFAMGTLFWELLTNQRLFNASNQYETLTLIGEPDVKPPSTVNGAISAEVDAIAMKALQADPEDRFQWASEFGDALQSYLMSQKPPYHRSQLTTWLRSAFEEEFEEEKEKRKRFREINSADDVRALFDESHGKGGEDEDEGVEDATQIWDVDEAPDSDVDLDAFVSNHTVVQAGGLELSDYDEWEDAPDTIDEEQEQPQIEEVPGESLNRIKIAAESKYEVPPTVISEPATENEQEGAEGASEHGTVEATPRSLGRSSAPSDAAPVSGLSTGGRDLPPRSHPPAKQRTSPGRQKTGPQNFSPPQGGADTTGPTAARRISGGADTTGGRPAPTANVGRMANSPTPPNSGVGTKGSTTGSMTPMTSPNTEVVAPGGMGRKRIFLALGVVALLGMIALSGVALLVVVGGDEEELSQTGAVLVEVQPPANLEIFVNEEYKGERAPLTLDELEPGDYRIKIDHPDHLVWSDEITVEPDAVTTVNADLAAEGTLVIQWETNPQGVTIYLDGESLLIGEEEQEVQRTLARGNYVLEANAEGMHSQRVLVSIDSDETTEQQLEWTRVDQLAITGADPLEVVLDGRSFGELPLVLQDLEPNRLYELEIGEFSTALGYPEFGRAEIQSGELDDLQQLEKRDYGWLIVDTFPEQTWQLVIDDVETGLFTPLGELGEIPVQSGLRTIGFQRHDERYDYRVRIISEEVTRFRPDFPD